MEKKKTGMSGSSLRDLLIQKVNALYDIEKVLVEALPNMVKAATDPGLKKVFAQHLQETETHVKRLETISGLLGQKPKALKSEAVRWLVKDGEWVIGHVKPKEARDSNLARAAQYIEHYEMAGYKAAIEWANCLEEGEIADLLVTSLREEDAADEALMDIGSVLDQRIA